jgi:hypothetical protein
LSSFVSLGTRRQCLGKYKDQETADLAILEFEARNPSLRAVVRFRYAVRKSPLAPPAVADKP